MCKEYRSSERKSVPCFHKDGLPTLVSNSETSDTVREGEMIRQGSSQEKMSVAFPFIFSSYLHLSPTYTLTGVWNILWTWIY